jgi:hypothetical protein
MKTSVPKNFKKFDPSLRSSLCAAEPFKKLKAQPKSLLSCAKVELQETGPRFGEKIGNFVKSCRMSGQ